MIDACSLEAKGLKTITQALDIIINTLKPISECEHITLKKALGRVLASPIHSPIEIPQERNSAMDGYAFSSKDIQPGRPFTLKLVGTSWAGHPYNGNLAIGSCIRIFTGATLPDGADSIIMQEQITAANDQITFPENTRAGEHVRTIGSDIAKSSELLSAPKKLTAMDLGLLASAGIHEVIVKRKLNIAFFSTGDELRAIGQKLDSGQIYDSNRYTLTGLLNDPQNTVHDLGVVADDKQLLENTLLNAANDHDVIISTGGASVGDADYIKEVLDENGNVGFWKIAIKPGKPLAFGQVKNCYFFGLPGNPVSVIATFHKIVAPALKQLTGTPAKKALQLSVICHSNLKKQTGRQEYQRGILSQNESGEFSVKSAGKQGSNIMSAMSKANCYIVLPIESQGVSIGEKVIVEPFDVML